MTILQNVVEEQSASMIARRQEKEARDLNCRLREEQDEAYRIGLLADQVCIIFPFLLSLPKEMLFPCHLSQVFGTLSMWLSH